SSQRVLRLDRGETLVPELDRQTEMVLESAREGAHALRLMALGAVHVEREADDHAARLEGSQDGCDGGEIAPAADPSHEPDPADGEPELVADGDADPCVAHIERGQPHARVVTPAHRAGKPRRCRMQNLQKTSLTLTFTHRFGRVRADLNTRVR